MSAEEKLAPSFSWCKHLSGCWGGCGRLPPLPKQRDKAKGGTWSWLSGKAFEATACAGGFGRSCSSLGAGSSRTPAPLPGTPHSRRLFPGRPACPGTGGSHGAAAGQAGPHKPFCPLGSAKLPPAPPLPLSAAWAWLSCSPGSSSSWFSPPSWLGATSRHWFAGIGSTRRFIRWVATHPPIAPQIFACVHQNASKQSASSP